MKICSDTPRKGVSHTRNINISENRLLNVVVKNTRDVFSARVVVLSDGEIFVGYLEHDTFFAAKIAGLKIRRERSQQNGVTSELQLMYHPVNRETAVKSELYHG